MMLKTGGVGLWRDLLAEWGLLRFEDRARAYLCIHLIFVVNVCVTKEMKQLCNNRTPVYLTGVSQNTVAVVSY